MWTTCGPTNHLRHIIFEARCAHAMMRFIDGRVRIQDRVMHDPINEVVHHGSDRIDAAKTIIERWL